MALLKYGKQIIGLSRNQQQLGFGRYLTTKSHHLCLGANDKSIIIPDNNHELELPSKTPLTFKGFFSGLFRKKYSPPAPPTPTPFKELLVKFTDLVEISKYYPEDHPPLDEISPVLNELLDRMSHESYVKLLYEFARPAASEADPPIVLDRKVKDFVDNIPPNIIHFFQDMMFRMIELRYRGKDRRRIKVSCLVPGAEITADVSHIGKEHLKVFVAEDILMVTGTDKASPPAPVYKATPKLMAKIPRFPYLRNQVTASIIQDQLKILFPSLGDSAVVNNPRVYQLNLNSN